METAALAQLFDKYGPLGFTIIILAALLVFFCWKVLPALNKTWADQIAAERENHKDLSEKDREAWKTALGIVGEKMDSHEKKSEERHGQVMDEFRAIRGSVRPFFPPEAKQP